MPRESAIILILRLRYMKKLILPVIALFCSLTTMGQDYAGSAADTWRIGVSAGYHGSWLNYTNLDKNTYPENKLTGSGLFSIFIEKEFGAEGNFAIRPEAAFLNRGGKLTGIGKNDYYPSYPFADVNYCISAHYADLRLPLIWRFGTTSSAIRPYIFAAPVLGFCTGGDINYRREYASGHDPEYEGVSLDITRANMRETYFAGAIGAGVNWYFNVNDSHRFFIGLEADYEHGFTDTYGNDNSAEVKIPVGDAGYSVEGKRRYRGFEVKLTFGVPFTVFSGAARRVKEDIDFDGGVPVPEVVEVVAEEPHERCYTIDEIADLMARGQSIDGKTICAIDDIVTFDFGKSTITPDSYPWLNRLAEMLRRANAYVCVSGHTDDIGEEDYNMRLSRDRAIAVYNYLIDRGVPANKISYAYYGESDPIATNETEEGRRLNRRVEFIINTPSN